MAMTHRLLTPWGEAETMKTFPAAPGVLWVSTPSHGGFMVTVEAAMGMPVGLRSIGQPWGAYLAFEEDCAWCAVALSFDVCASGVERLAAGRVLNEVYPLHADGGDGCGRGQMGRFHSCPSRAS